MTKSKCQAALPDPVESAALAGLRYVNGGGPGIRRKRHGKSFQYLGVDGKPLRDAQHLQRIRSLVLPPAWENVWICPLANGHLQAIGFDARGRKQYRYHPKYREVRNETKFKRMLDFARALPKIRSRVHNDLSLPGLTREKVIATVVRLLETTFIRIGNVEYARDNQSFGLTTLRNRHVQLEGSTIKFRFRGKSGQEHDIKLQDRRVARIVRACQDLPGYEVFQYLDEAGERHTIDSCDVNAYLQEVSGSDFTAKDFRTWSGTVQSALALAERPFTSDAEAKKNIVEAVKETARRLGNRPATCRKYYIHPTVLEAYTKGTLLEFVRGTGEEFIPTGTVLHPEERAVFRLIEAFEQVVSTQAA